MPFLKLRDGNSLHYKDMGSGRPVLLVHGWPLTGDMWEYQTLALLEAGYRVITYDRRGFGQSSHPFGGYDYETLTQDLAELIDHLDLTNMNLVGFSMGGGEVVRYVSQYGMTRVASVGLIASIVPYLLRTDDNPDGVPSDIFAEFKAQIRRDRFHFLAEFLKGFYGVSLLRKPVSQALIDWSFTLGTMASPSATLDCIDSFSRTDFRADLAALTLPTLVIHGTGDKTVPYELTGKRVGELVPHARYIEYDSAPHGLFATDAEALNHDLLGFLSQTRS